MSINGVDIRKFGSTPHGGFKPQHDPYYGRKPVDAALTVGVGETENTPAEDFAVRERKQSVLEFSEDPFQLITGTGHRQSISSEAVVGVANAATGEQRRRSSAVAPDAVRHGSGGSWQGLSQQRPQYPGYGGAVGGGERLEPIVSRADAEEGGGVGGVGGDRNVVGGDVNGAGSHAGMSSGGGAFGAGAGERSGQSQHARVHDATTQGHNHGSHGLVSEDPLDVAPDDTRVVV